MRSKNGEDRLSRLPEEILSHILSRMPTKFAVQTSILSKRWRYSWTFVKNLDFDDIHDKNILSKSMDRVMEFCKSSQIQLFRLHFSKRCNERSNVSNWIDKVVRLKVRELDIEVMKLELPLSMFTCNTLTKLRLNCSIYDQTVWDWTSSVYLPCLETLDIVVFTNPFVNAFRLIRGCPMLESLSLEVKWCNNEDYIFEIPTLKRLKLTFASIVNKVVLHVPNLEYLFVGGMLGSLFVMNDLPPLVEASVSFIKLEVPLSMFTCKTLIKLRLSRSDYDKMSDWEFPCSINLPCLKTLDIAIYTNPYINAFRLIHGCPMLESLSLEIYKHDEDCILNIPTLKRLKLTLLCSSVVNKVVLHVPNLEYLFVDGVLCSIFCSDGDCPSSVNLPCLKTLEIVDHHNPFVKAFKLNAFKLIHGCPMLESLSLDVTILKDEEDYIFNIPTLKRLKLTFQSFIYKVINKVVLNVPNLEYLFVGGVVCSLFVMEDVSSLVEASISVSLCYICYDRLWIELLTGISGVKSLLAQNIPSTLLLPIFPNIKHLELKSFRLRFLESCPGLKHLHIEKLEESSWIEPKLVPACMITNLTTIKFSKCKGQKCDIEFLEYMLENAKVLKTITITWENLCIEEETRLCAQLLKIPRASRYCEIIFLGNCSPYS